MPPFTIHDRFNATQSMLMAVEHNMEVFKRELPDFSDELKDLYSDLRTFANRIDRLHHDYANNVIAAADRMMPDSFGADPTMEH